MLALLNACAEPAGASLAKKRRGILAKAALELLYASGLRISELLALPRKAIAGDQRMIMVRGKGGRERLVPLSDSAREAAQALLEVDAHLESPFLFPGRDPAKPMTRQAFDRILHTVAIRAEIDPARLSPTCCAIPLLRICWRMGRFAGLADVAGACRHRHHPDLHSCADRTPAKGRAGASPSGGGFCPHQVKNRHSDMFGCMK